MAYKSKLGILETEIAIKNRNIRNRNCNKESKRFFSRNSFRKIRFT